MTIFLVILILILGATACYFYIKRKTHSKTAVDAKEHLKAVEKIEQIEEQTRTRAKMMSARELKEALNKSMEKIKGGLDED